MKTRTLELVVHPTGELSIDAVGFRGSDCEQATAFFEQALGLVRQRQRKPEHQARARRHTVQPLQQ